MAQNSAGGSGGASRYRSDIATKLSDSTDGVTPEVIVEYVSSTEGSGGSDVTVKTTISGSQTNSLTIKSDAVGIQTVRCLIKHPTAALNFAQARNPSEPNESDGVLDGGLLSVTRNFETISSVNTRQSFLTYELVRDDDVNRFGRLHRRGQIQAQHVRKGTQTKQGHEEHASACWNAQDSDRNRCEQQTLHRRNPEHDGHLRSEVCIPIQPQKPLASQGRAIPENLFSTEA